MFFNISEATDCYRYSKYVNKFKKISFNDLTSQSSYRIRILRQFQTAIFKIQNNMFWELTSLTFLLLELIYIFVKYKILQNRASCTIFKKQK